MNIGRIFDDPGRRRIHSIHQAIGYRLRLDLRHTTPGYRRPLEGASAQFIFVEICLHLVLILKPSSIAAKRRHNCKSNREEERPLENAPWATLESVIRRTLRPQMLLFRLRCRRACRATRASKMLMCSRRFHFPWMMILQFEGVPQYSLRGGPTCFAGRGQ